MPSSLATPGSGRLRRFDTPRINRAPSKILAISAPWLLVMLGSLSPTWPIIASGPVVPPLGFLFLVIWQQLRPGLFPVWAGLPLGLFDDLFSGQPFGSAVMLWSAATIILDLFEARFPWRSVVFNWLVASCLTVLYLVSAAYLAGAGHAALLVILPQILLSILICPLLALLVNLTDRFRLIPIRKR